MAGESLLGANKTTFIYTLSDPTNSQVRYVGKTNNIDQRYKRHLSIKRKRNHKESWVLSLKNRGLKPEIDIVDVVPFDEWEFWERHYISLFKSWGFNLTNKLDGGNQPPITDETRKIISEIGKKLIGNKNPFYGKTHSLETRKILAQKSMGHTPWNKGLKDPYTAEQLLNISRSIEAMRLSNIGRKHNKERVSKAYKSILQYDNNGVFLKEWESIKQAGFVLRISPSGICECCKGIHKRAGGFIWKYKLKI